MTRYLLVDRNTGYVRGEERAGSPSEAAETLDATGTGGYLVHVAPNDFPDVLDGRDPSLIEAVSALPCIAFVERTDPVA